MLTRLTAKGRHVTCLVAALTACTGENEYSNGILKGIYNGTVGEDNVKGALVNRPVKVSAIVDNACAALVL